MTPTTNDAYDVIVVGAGVNGCVAARELAADHDVLVLDKGQIAGDTTGKASGLVSIIHDYEDHPDAARYAIDFFEEYDGTGNFSYTDRANVELVHPVAEETRRAAAKKFEEAGFDVSFLTTEEVENRYPDTFILDEFVGAVEYREGGWVDPYTFTITLKDDAEAAGAEFRTGVTVEAIRTSDGSVDGVSTDVGAFDAPNVVVAAGWRTRDMVAEFTSLPIRPFRYQTVNLETSREFEDWYPVAWEGYTNLYWRPEHNGDLHVGGGTYFSQEPPDVRSKVTAEFRNLVADAIFQYVEGIEDARFASGDICPTGDAATPDGYPIIDAPAEAPEGLIVATGSHGFGIMAAPVTGVAVRSLVTDEYPPFSLTPFALDRFDSRSTDFESSYIAETPSGLPSP